MKKINKFLVVPFIVLCGQSLTSCGSSSTNGLTLRILNSEDYIYLNDPSDPESAPDLIEQFKEYIEENYPQYHGVNVVYDTSDTNETIYSELMTGKSNYDLINVSDYMAQKIVSGGYAVPYFKDHPVENYEEFASKELKGRLDSITAVQKVYNESTQKWEDQEEVLADYAVGYMWGTLGILFNPYYNTGITPNDILEDVEEHEELLEVIDDMRSFNSFWDNKYQGTISIKNSMRDTYALGLLHAYDEEFKAIREQYLLDGDLEKYQAEFTEIFNRCEQENVDDVADALNALKSNIFGLEVDSGKQDIVTQKIGINLAWSGDAVYSMDQANDPELVGSDLVDLCYAVPENGSNLWMDVWVMPNCPRSEEQGELAKLFLEFICDPVNAYQNMDYTGYTSFIGGDDIIDLVRDWYDVRTEEVYYIDDEEVYYSVYSVNSTEFTEIEYEDLLSADHDVMREEEELVYFIPYINDDEELVEEPEELQELLDNSESVMIYDEELEEERVKTYGDLTLVDEEYEEVDLTYFFDGTTDEYDEEAFVFYSDCYLPFSILEDEEVQNIAVGRQFFCQYPSEEVIERTAVMRDYGENNKLVMKMWENFKSNPLPTGSVVLFVVIIAVILAIASSLLVNNILKTRIRNKRKANK